MTNKEIARAFQLLAGLMELHGDNPFKIRSYQNAYASLRKLDRPLAEMTDDEISEIKGIGKAIVGKIRELLQKGEMNKLTEFKAKTPEGIQELLGIKGLGPKKIRVIWKDLGVESPGELLYACYENRLVELSGFGLKTQEDIRRKIEYFQESRNKYLYAFLEDNFLSIYDSLHAAYPDCRLDFVGEISRKCPVIHQIELILEKPAGFTTLKKIPGISWQHIDGNVVACTFRDLYPFTLHLADAEDYLMEKFRLTGTMAFVDAISVHLPEGETYKAEEEIFAAVGKPYCVPELREDPGILETSRDGFTDLIELEDIRGVLHNHSTYSDGLHTLQEMSVYVRDAGYAYFGISDHSKTAVYAGGLQPGDVLTQLEEIDRINAELHPFRVFKGIESDILTDGSLDYEEDILARFDFIVASIHSNLNMDEQKATERLIKAIENPFTRILGHPTGRLLLTRKGYPIDHIAVIDACAANGVAIELNANPLRLDMDYRWLPYAQEKGVLIAINPDAHSMESIHNMRYGVMAARKGLLSKAHCLNTKSLTEFEQWLQLS